MRSSRALALPYAIIEVMVVSFEIVTHSRRSEVEMFDRARDIGLHAESQASAGERAVGGVVKGLIGLGEEVTWQARHFGINLHLTSTITALDAPRYFTDEQTRGPFKAFRHEHHFEARGTGSLMIDRISFAAPLGILGRIAERLILAHYMRRLIEKRGDFLAGTTEPE